MNNRKRMKRKALSMLPFGLLLSHFLHDVIKMIGGVNNG